MCFVKYIELITSHLRNTPLNTHSDTMGICQSNESKVQKAANDQIENQLRADREAQAKEVKMLLLGTILSSASTASKYY